MKRFSRPLLPALLAAGLVAAGCTPLRSHQGYIVDADLVNSVQPGVDTKESVLATLGKPSISGQFDDRDWYYVARDTRNFAFRNPTPTEQLTLQVSVDERGTVSGIRRGGKEQIASINPYGKTTPTLGKKRGFFEDLFGNIGAVGAPGAGGGGGGNRDQP